MFIAANPRTIRRVVTADVNVRSNTSIMIIVEYAEYLDHADANNIDPGVFGWLSVYKRLSPGFIFYFFYFFLMFGGATKEWAIVAVRSDTLQVVFNQHVKTRFYIRIQATSPYSL